MTVIATIPLVVAILGALVYLLAAKAEAKELGRITFAVGLLWFVYQFAHEVVKF